MPIYAYRCSSCNHAQDILRKISDTPLVTCTACGKDTFTKQVTAAGFALKGSGWYVTDFRGEGGSKSSDGTASAPKKTETTAESASSTSSSDTSASSSASPASAASAPPSTSSPTPSSTTTTSAAST